MSTDLVAPFRDKRFIDTRSRCDCCGSGWPCCADVDVTTGSHFEHFEVCRFGDSICAACSISLALRLWGNDD